VSKRTWGRLLTSSDKIDLPCWLFRVCTVRKQSFSPLWCIVFSPFAYEWGGSVNTAYDVQITANSRKTASLPTYLKSEIIIFPCIFVPSGMHWAPGQNFIVFPLLNFTTPNGVLRVFEHLTRFLQTQNRLCMYNCRHATVIPKMPSKVQVFETKSHIFQTVFYFL